MMIPLFIGTICYGVTIVQTIRQRNSVLSLHMYLPFVVRVLIFSITFWILFLFLMIYRIYDRVYYDDIVSSYTDYYFCLISNNDDNNNSNPRSCTLSADLTTYTYVALHAFAVSDLGLVLFLIFASKEMFVQWGRVLASCWNGGRATLYRQEWLFFPPNHSHNPGWNTHNNTTTNLNNSNNDENSSDKGERAREPTVSTSDSERERTAWREYTIGAVLLRNKPEPKRSAVRVVRMVTAALSGILDDAEEEEEANPHYSTTTVTGTPPTNTITISDEEDASESESEFYDRFSWDSVERKKKERGEQEKEKERERNSRVRFAIDRSPLRSERDPLLEK